MVLSISASNCDYTKSLADMPTAPDMNGYVIKYLKDLCHQVEVDLV